MRQQQLLLFAWYLYYHCLFYTTVGKVQLLHGFAYALGGACHPVVGSNFIC